MACSILLALAGLVLPAIGGGRTWSPRRTGAQGDMQAIAAGLSRYKQDTLTLPTGVEGRTNLTWLYGPGRIPAGQAFGSPAESRALADALLNDSLGRSRWAGPYIKALHADPWGNAYLVNADGWITPGEMPIVVSAGPDGVIETSPWARTPAGDDLLLVVE